MFTYKYTNSENGLCRINRNLAKFFLSLDGSYNHIKPQDKATAELLQLLGAFDLLCNMNGRDRALADRQLRLLANSELTDEFSEIYLGLSRWAEGLGEHARPHLAAHLQQFSEDYIALFILHMFDFLHGRPDLYTQYLIADARGEHPDFGSYYKGMVAFSLCENSQPAAALPLATQACDRVPLNDIYSIHALVHCWHSVNDHRTVVDFLEASKHQWLDNPGMNMHVHWHLAVSYLELGDINKAVESYWSFRNLMACAHAEQDLDAVNFCARVFLTGVPRPDFHNEYKILAKNWAPSIYNSLSYFSDVHAAFAFMMAGETTLMQKLLARPSIFGADADAVEAGEEILQSIADFMGGDFSACAERLHSTRPNWHRIGGSQAQREILQLLSDSAEAMTQKRHRLQFPQPSALRNYMPQGDSA